MIEEWWREVEGIAMEAREKAEAMEVKVECLKGVLAKAEAELALKKGRRAEPMEAKEIIAKVRRKAEERVAEAKFQAMVEYKASAYFTTEKDRVVVAFRTSEKFYNNCIKFSEEAF